MNCTVTSKKWNKWLNEDKYTGQCYGGFEIITLGTGSLEDCLAIAIKSGEKCQIRNYDSKLNPIIIAKVSKTGKVARL